MTSTVTLISMGRYVIDTHAPEPSYLQSLRSCVPGSPPGRWPREALPWITYLTGETGLAVGTIRKAIGVLVEEGLAYTVPGRGTFASPRKNYPRGLVPAPRHGSGCAIGFPPQPRRALAPVVLAREAGPRWARLGVRKGVGGKSDGIPGAVGKGSTRVSPRDASHLRLAAPGEHP